jgi:hypothetical protein
VVTVAPETVSAAEPDRSPPYTRLASLAEAPPVPTEPPAEAKDTIRQEAPPPPRQLHLRIFRDSEHCPKTACYKWHVLGRHTKLPPATLELAELRLAPSIRQAAESGKVELIVDAVEQHKTIRGRDRVAIVATSLAGVTPHEEPFAAFAASGP